MTNQSFQTIGLIGKYDDPHTGGTIRDLSDFFSNRGLRVVLDDATAKNIGNTDLESGSREFIGEHCDAAVVIGGDGTLLNAARSLADHDVAVIGVNLGHLGFLADISVDGMLEKMEQILAGNYRIEERFLLQSAIYRDGKRVSDSVAFNDCVVHKWNVARMIELETYINGRFVNKLRADGLIIATPTGSTAYALSAGGPILHPTLNALVMVPVCPHTMSNRPIVVNGDSEIEIAVCKSRHESTQLTCDGQITFGLMSDDRIQIRKKDRPVRLIHLADHDHFEILRAKLSWAENPKAGRK